MDWYSEDIHQVGRWSDTEEWPLKPHTVAQGLNNYQYSSSKNQLEEAFSESMHPDQHSDTNRNNLNSACEQI